jgi:hypothetical protein
MTEEESTRQRIGNVLNSTPCKRINFFWAGNHISGTCYAYLALALLSPASDQQGIQISVAKQDKGVAAHYDPDTNVLSLRTYNFGYTPKERMTIVHEFTHAVIDEFGTSPTTRAVDHEIASYIASFLYNVYSSADPANGPYGYEPPRPRTPSSSRRKRWPSASRPARRVRF